MADLDALIRGLENYEASLGRHLSQLQGEYDQVSQTWARLNQVYDGEAAEQFRQGWTRTSQRFQEYIEQTTRLRTMLNDRLIYLREANRAGAG